MQWIFALIGYFLAESTDSNVFVAVVFGFLLGHYFSVSSRIKKLELQLDEFRQELKRLKPSQKSFSETVSQAEQYSQKVAVESLHFKEDECQQVDVLEVKPQAEASQDIPVPVPDPDPDPDPWMVLDTEPKVESWATKKEEIAVDYTDPGFSQLKIPAIAKLFQLVWNWFTDGNTFVRVGIVILFVGVSFLLSFAIDKGVIPIELRLVVVTGFALFLLSIGWKLRDKRTGYALLIQGGAVGLLYLTIFASFSLYQVLPASIAFGFLIIIIALSTCLAVLQNALPLMLFGVIGGFLAPILTSTGSNNYIGLFSFYALLNAGIFAVAWFKAWKILNLVGFTFTFSISSFWGMSRYQPENFASIEPFLVLFFLFYVGIAILYASRRAPDFKDYVDGTLIFGTPIIAFGMQAAIVNRFDYGVAISAIVMGGFYLLLAYWSWKKFADELRFLSETLLAIAVIFATLAIPFAVDGATTAAAWAVEATGVLWVSIRQGQPFRRVVALMLQLLAGIALLLDSSKHHDIAFLNSTFTSVLIVTICAGISSWMLYQPYTDRRSYEAKLSPWILAYSLVWLFGGYEYQIESHKELAAYHGNLTLFLTLLCNTLLIWVSKRFSWTTAGKAALWMLLPLLFVISGMITQASYLLEHYGAVFWSLAIVVYFVGLKKIEDIDQIIRLYLHLFTTTLIYCLLYREGMWQVLLGASLLTILFYQLYKHYQWIQMRTCAFALLPLMIFLTFSCFLSKNLHPFELPDYAMGISWSFEAGYVLWPFAFAVLYRLFYRCDKDNSAANTLPLFHVLALILLLILPTWEASWHLSYYMNLLNGWHIALFPLTTIAVIWLIMQAKIWPFKQHVDAYYRLASPVLLFFLFVWTLIALFSSASAMPLPWVPLFNPAEIVQAITFITLIKFVFVAPETNLSNQDKMISYTVIASFIFIWLNFVLLRTIHHWGGFPWSPSLWQVPVTQTCLSVFWTLTGLSFAVLATRKQVRKLWLVGATLLVIVVIKLLLLDMSSNDSIERIISFISVGILLMLIGYFAPLPPADKEVENA